MSGDNPKNWIEYARFLCRAGDRNLAAEAAVKQAITLYSNGAGGSTSSGSGSGPGANTGQTNDGTGPGQAVASNSGPGKSCSKKKPLQFSSFL